MIRAAILGLGRWGRSLVTSVQGKSREIRFVAAHTRTREAAEPFCREHSIDAVVLATPHTLHAEQVERAVAAGKHVFVEKPITLTRASAEAAVAAARAA